MARSQIAYTYNEPTVMWRMQRGNGQAAQAVIAPGGEGGSVVVWYLNGRPLGMREFADWTSAIAWTDRMRDQNWAAGWRLSPDDSH